MNGLSGEAVQVGVDPQHGALNMSHRGLKPEPHWPCISKHCSANDNNHNNDISFKEWAVSWRCGDANAVQSGHFVSPLFLGIMETPSSCPFPVLDPEEAEP